MNIRPVPVTRADLAHDAAFDGGFPAGARNTPVHGWILQEIWDVNLNTDFDEAGTTPIANPAVFARTLGQGIFAHTPTPGDTPVLNAQ
jgi:hypothetical protein